MNTKFYHITCIIRLSAVAVSLLFATACQKVDDVPPPTVEFRLLKDDLGRDVRLPKKVERAISLAPNITEMIFAIGAGDRLVGDTTYCNYPEEAKAIPKVGDTLNPNLETVVALKPDVVLVSGASQLEAFSKILEQNGTAVYVTNPTSLDDVFKELGQLGSVFGTTAMANKLVDNLKLRLSAIHRFIEKDRSGELPTTVFVQISKEPLFTIGHESFLTDALEHSYAQSVTATIGSAYPKLSKETALALNPEAIIISESPDNQEPNDAFRKSPAVRNGRIFKVNADLLSRPGPRLIDALEQIAKMLHPEKFPE